MSQSDFWNKFKQRFKEVSSAAADFTEEQALIGKLKFEILTLKRKADRLNTNLGKRFYELSKIDPRPDVFEEIDIQAFIDEISDLLIQIDVKRKEITQVADHFRTKAKESVKQDTKTVKTKQTDPFVPPEGKKSDEEKDDDIIEKKDKPSETLEEDKKAKPKKRSPRKAKRTTSTKTQKPGISDKKI